MEAHDLALTKGGRAGIISEASVLSAIGRPYSGYYRTLAAKGAALLEAIIRNHGFADGNKRTAALLLYTLIERSGAALAPIGAEDLDAALEEVIVAVAAGAMGREAVEDWLRPRIARR